MTVGLWGLAVHADSSDPIVITATKTPVEEYKSAIQTLPHETTRAVEKQIVYSFDLRNMSTALNEPLTVEWLVAVEGATGRTSVGAAGRTNLALPFGTTVTLKTAPVELLGREFDSRHFEGSFSALIRGYAIRLLNANKEPVMERFDPDTLKGQIDWKQVDHLVASHRRDEGQPRLAPVRIR